MQQAGRSHRSNQVSSFLGRALKARCFISCAASVVLGLTPFLWSRTRTQSTCW